MAARAAPSRPAFGRSHFQLSWAGGQGRGLWEGGAPAWATRSLSLRDAAWTGPGTWGAGPPHARLGVRPDLGGHLEVLQAWEQMSGWGMGSQTGRRGRPRRACPPGPAVLPGGGPGPTPAGGRSSLGQLSGEGAGPGPRELGAPSCAIPGTLLPPIMTHWWPYFTLGQASPQWESGLPVLRKPCVLAHCPAPAWPPDPAQQPKHLAPRLAPGLACTGALHCSPCSFLCSGGPALTVPVHGPSLKASCRPAQLCQASQPLCAS